MNMAGMLIYAAYVDDLQSFVPSREASECLMVAPEQFIKRYEAGNKAFTERAVTRAQASLHLRSL